MVTSTAISPPTCSSGKQEAKHDQWLLACNVAWPTKDCCPALWPEQTKEYIRQLIDRKSEKWNSFLS